MISAPENVMIYHLTRYNGIFLNKIQYNSAFPNIIWLNAKNKKFHS